MAPLHIIASDGLARHVVDHGPTHAKATKLSRTSNSKATTQREANFDHRNDKNQLKIQVEFFRECFHMQEQVSHLIHSAQKHCGLNHTPAACLLDLQHAF